MIRGKSYRTNREVSEFFNNINLTKLLDILLVTSHNLQKMKNTSVEIGNKIEIYFHPNMTS